MKNKILKILDSECLPINDKDNELIAQQICDLFEVSNCSCINRDTLTPEARKMFDDIDKALERKK